jgi:competence protein ComEC
MRQAFRITEAPFIRLMIPFCAGTAIAVYVPLPGIFHIVVSCSIVSFLSLILFISRYSRWNMHRRKWVAGLVLQVFVLSFSYGYAIYKSGVLPVKPKPAGEALIIRVASGPVEAAASIRFEAVVQGSLSNHRWIPWHEKIMLTGWKDASSSLNITYGDLLLVPSRLQGVTHALNPKQFDYGKWLELRSIRHHALLRMNEISLISHGGWSITGFALGWRQRLIKKYSKFIRDPGAAAFLSALILGYRADIDRETVTVYSNTGTTHVLSVSGMHVGIVYVVLVVLLKFMDAKPWLKVVRALLIIILILFYSVLTGLSPAVCRSAVMLIFLVLSKAIGRDIHKFNLLALSAFLLLVYDPAFIADVGFQLSYLAVWGLFYLYPLIYDSVVLRFPLADKLWACFSVSLAAQIATFPLSLYYFHQFPVYFLLSNLFILLPVATIMYLGIVFLFLPFTPVLSVLGSALGKLIAFMNGGLAMISNFPGACLRDLWPTGLECLLTYGAILLCARIYIRREKWLLYLLPALGIALACSFSVKKVRQMKTHQLIVFSLEKHTAIGFLSGRTGIVLTDLDPSDKQFALAVRPYFSFCGIGDPEVFRIGDSVQTPEFYYRDNFVAFNGKTLLLAGKDTGQKKFGSKIRVDYVVLMGNCRMAVPDLTGMAYFGRLLIDGSNSPYRTEKWTKESWAEDIAFYVVRGSPAFIVDG